MTKEELALQITGREYPLELLPAEKRFAKDSGLVIVYGASDDLMEFEGAIEDEIGAYEGTTARIHQGGVLQRHYDCECEYCGYKTFAKQSSTIKAVWGKGGYLWTYKTDIPHATFEIVRGKDKYCRGIVISLADLPKIN